MAAHAGDARETLVCFAKHPQTGATVSSGGSRAASNRSPNIALGKLSAPPKVDGVLGEGEWGGATRVELAYQIEPGDNTPASERTEVYLACDREHLYLAFHAFESEPGAVRAPVSRRDDIFNDDNVEVMLDTYDDRQRAYILSVNAAGVQADGIHTNNSRPDYSVDVIFESKAAVTGDGYVVEMRIPFQSLRFKAGRDAKWGPHLRRWIARKAEHTSWTPFSRDNSGMLIQMGALAGLDEVYSGRTLDLIPTVTGSITSEREAAPQSLLTPPSGARLNTVNRMEPGLTLIYSITSNLTLSATVNPDFAQVEADVPQINVNQRFALFFPERRPFFLECSEIFRSSGLQIVNTRQIVDPDWGVKLTCKLGRNAIGLLAAADRCAWSVRPLGRATTPRRGIAATTQDALLQAFVEFPNIGFSQRAYSRERRHWTGLPCMTGVRSYGKRQ